MSIETSHTLDKTFCPRKDCMAECTRKLKPVNPGNRGIAYSGFEDCKDYKETKR